MRWSEHQLAMLGAMGLRLWQPAQDADAACPPDPPATGRRPVPVGAPSVAPDHVPPITTGERPAASAPELRAAPASARPGPCEGGAVADMDWPALRAAVAGCTACGLCQSRTQTVFGVGHPRAHWMIVGEAPGEQEDLRGEPFVGAAGRLLDRMLMALGLTRQAGDAEHQVYIANTLKCRPPRNRNPEPQELAQCLPFLERQLELVQPRVVLAMGRFAVQSLLGSSEPIGRLRGRVHQWRGRPLVVTYHPAYLLRQPTEKARAWADLCLAADVMQRKPTHRAGD